MHTIQVADPLLFTPLSKQLLDQLAQFLRDQKCLLVTYIYSKDLPEVSELEYILNQKHWTVPQPFVIRYHFDALAYAEPWYLHYRKSRLPEKRMKIFPWKKLKPFDRQMLQHMQYEGVFPVSVSPFYQEDTIEPINSLGVRYDEKIIGWLITHRLDPETICYSSIFILPEFRNTIVPLYLIAKSIELHQKSQVPKAIVEVNPVQVDQSWISFVKKRLVPGAHHTEQLFETYCNLQEMPLQ